MEYDAIISRALVRTTVLLLVLVATSHCCSGDSPSSSLCCRGASRAPVMLQEPLRFCSSTGLTSCCSKMDDAEVESMFLRHAAQIKNVSYDPRRAKASLCSRCIPATTKSSCANNGKRPPIEMRAPETTASSGGIFSLISVGAALVIGITIFFKVLAQDDHPRVNCGSWFSNNNCFIWGSNRGEGQAELV